MPNPKKHALFPLAYDEISLVDEGAAGSADVLIMKRAEISKRPRTGSDVKIKGLRGKKGGRSKTVSEKMRDRYADSFGGGGKSSKKKKKKSGNLSAGTTDGSSGGKKSSGGKSQSNPCSTKTNSTGSGKGGRNFKEGRHPRDNQGQFDETSSESKAKYGKGGSTKAKIDAKCKDKKKGGGKSGPTNDGPRGGGNSRAPKSGRGKTSRQYANQYLKKNMDKKDGGRDSRPRKGFTSMGNWDSSTLLMEKMERKATR